MSAAETPRRAVHESTVALVSGLLAGFATTVVLHPLDLIKTRFQVDEGSRGSLWKRLRARGGLLGPLSRSAAPIAERGVAPLTIKDLARQLGGRGLYRGVVPAIIGSSSSWGLYFLFYERFKKEVAGAEQRRLGSLEYLWTSALAGALTTLCTNPVWLIKTRMELQTPGNEPYGGFLHALRTIMRQEGVAGLYKGIVPALFLVSNGAVQWMVYEEMKQVMPGPLGAQEYMLLGAISKSIASTLTYPYQVVKTRMQQHQSKYTSTWATLVSTSRQGIWGLYRGLVPNLLRVMPASAITVSVYETCKTTLSAL